MLARAVGVLLRDLSILLLLVATQVHSSGVLPLEARLDSSPLAGQLTSLGRTSQRPLSDATTSGLLSFGARNLQYYSPLSRGPQQLQRPMQSGRGPQRPPHFSQRSQGKAWELLGTGHCNTTGLRSANIRTRVSSLAVVRAARLCEARHNCAFFSMWSDGQFVELQLYTSCPEPRQLCGPDTGCNGLNEVCTYGRGAAASGAGFAAPASSSCSDLYKAHSPSPPSLALPPGNSSAQLVSTQASNDTAKLERPETGPHPAALSSPASSRAAELRLEFNRRLERRPVNAAARMEARKRDTDTNCNWQCYLDRYPDLQKAFGNPSTSTPIARAMIHWRTYGQSEGRICTCDGDAGVRYEDLWKQRCPGRPLPAPNITNGNSTLEAAHVTASEEQRAALRVGEAQTTGGSCPVMEDGQLRPEYLPAVLDENIASADTGTVFIILRHMSAFRHRALWRTSYAHLRYLYPHNRIIILDDHSTVQDGCSDGIEIIQSEFKGRGEVLPYYYFHKLKLGESMLYIFDSIFVQKALDLSQPQVMWTAKHEWDSPSHLNLFTGMKNPAALKSLKLEEWDVAFGAMSFVTWDMVHDLDERFSFFDALLPRVHNRPTRMDFERVWGRAMSLYNFSAISMFGDLHEYIEEKVRPNVLGYGAVLGTCGYSPFSFDLHQYHRFKGNLAMVPAIKVWQSR
ncbi:hypothetical protein CYMTET_53903 [Cymbomonas tetramitiformis]|uniref:Uncharacterized protein n=1 Tax=Cymbomonas tetramitiformis TaxID=36881 RepID=A0AAE0EPL7_9CHLO|nr:hypothetical protein CYMTET_53903 [Cymbomonas tetramitiformis]